MYNTLQDNSTDIGDWYEYKKMVQFKNSISDGFKLFTTIKERKIIRLLSMQVGRQVREHPSGAKQGWSEANVQH